MEIAEACRKEADARVRRPTFANLLIGGNESVGILAIACLIDGGHHETNRNVNDYDCDQEYHYSRRTIPIFFVNIGLAFWGSIRVCIYIHRGVTV